MRELIPPHKRTVELTFEIFTIKLVKENLLTFSEAYDIFESQKGSSDT